MEGGDPNIISKVFTEILSKFDDNSKIVIAKAGSVPDGLRHLRNYAKARNDTQLMNEIASVMHSSSSGKVSDY